MSWPGADLGEGVAKGEDCVWLTGQGRCGGHPDKRMKSRRISDQCRKTSRTYERAHKRARGSTSRTRCMSKEEALQLALRPQDLTLTNQHSSISATIFTDSLDPLLPSYLLPAQLYRSPEQFKRPSFRPLDRRYRNPPYSASCSHRSEPPSSPSSSPTSTRAHLQPQLPLLPASI